ncbi:RagB/SusD family nutrient uptake outer membrane protein [Pontibacter qinzhouensis]|uniref:RagB/SusD family nutrient uptake outer membrane protein n=1 Tax=Pontibacter qinzhouensis TaxID=2603253 RepID=A0A5C8K585_9BACT|nr:RagB/SusD family nutrient uptake outer membrane protein [Pontibacter qinzhouensis]TXK45762.1 RagB/SusD family nutrient uptake outer membrane protein [Pontibacter qinzhouensis]
MKLHTVAVGLSLGCVLAFSACKDIIEIEPDLQRAGSPQGFSSLDEHEFALTGAYALFRAPAYYGNGSHTTGSWASLPDMMADDLVQTTEDFGNWGTQANWTYATDEADIEMAWVAAYSVIGQANLTLRNIDQFAATDAKRVNRIQGQALAIRAMAHFDLLRFWGESLDRNSAAKGVPYKTTVAVEDLPARLTVKETYDNILKDLEAAEALLSDVDKVLNTPTNRAYLDQVATQALLARVNLYTKEYEAAERYATSVITALPLADQAAFPGIWKDTYPANSEVIWKVTYSPGEGNVGLGIHIGSVNRNLFRPATHLEGLFNQANDVRFAAYFGSRATGNNTPIYAGNSTPASGGPIARRIVTKFIGRANVVDNLLDWKVLRTGEMYLIRAEARATQGGTKLVTALADLNALRAARIRNYEPVVIVGEQALLNAIALERRKELFAEGHRWFDLKRTSRTITRTDKEVLSANTSLAPAAREWAWPIPQGEIDANHNIEQTTGYN